MLAFYYTVNILLSILFGIVTRRKVRGRENVPPKGSLILVSNHLNNADIPLLAINFPRGIVFMAKEELFRSPVGWAIKASGALPVRRGLVDRATLRIANQVLKDGKVLGIYPEGTRSRTGRLQPARPGVALIARESQSLLLPVGIYGTEKMRGLFWWLHRPTVTVNIGKPFSLPTSSNEHNKEELALFTTYIMRHIAELLPPEYRGVYGESHQPQLNSPSIAPAPLRGEKLGG
mgnify:CR=1 FL=1